MTPGTLYETITTKHQITQREDQRALGILGFGKMELGKLSCYLTTIYGPW